jgi:pseudouridine synthase
MERLQKILSQAGIASRRASEKLMLEGRVTVNGVTVRELGSKADAARDDIRVDGRRIKVVERHRYLLLNKPRGYVTTRSDPQRRPTVIDLLRGVREYVYPVGRLDYDSEGLLLLTNDGDLANRLLHPSFGIEKEYLAEVAGTPTTAALARLRAGVELDDGRARVRSVRIVDARGERAQLSLVMTEGRKREVRRLLASVELPVARLVRLRVGPVRLGRLRPAEVRALSAEELLALRRTVAKAERRAARQAPDRA